MKQLLIRILTVLALLTVVLTMTQAQQATFSSLDILKTMKIPRYASLAAASPTGNQAGNMIFVNADSTVYIRNQSNTAWLALTGGGGAIPVLSSGSVAFSNGTTLVQDNDNFFWNNTLKRLGIGTNTPSATFNLVQSAPATVSGGNGTANVSPFNITGGAGGSTSYSTGFVSAGNSGEVLIKTGNGGNITGTPTYGVGGTAGGVTILAGDGGTGTDIGGNGGSVEVQGGSGGYGLVGNGTAGYTALKGGNAFPVGNSDGGNIFVIGGIPSGTGVAGEIFLGVSPSLAVRSNVTIGSSTRGAGKLNVTGNTNLTGSLKIADGTQGAGNIFTSDADGLGSWQSTIDWSKISGVPGGVALNWANSDLTLTGDRLHDIGSNYFLGILAGGSSDFFANDQRQIDISTIDGVSGLTLLGGSAEIYAGSSPTGTTQSLYLGPEQTFLFTDSLVFTERINPHILFAPRLLENTTELEMAGFRFNSPTGKMQFKDSSGAWTAISSLGGTTETASEGLTKVGNDIRFGGAVTSNRTVTTGANSVTFDGTSGQTLKGINDAGTGVVGESNTGNGSSFSSNTGYPIVATLWGGDNNTIYTQTRRPVTTGITRNLRLTAISTSGTPTTGFGTSIEFGLAASDGMTRNSSILESYWTSSTATNETSDFGIKNKLNGADVSGLVLKGTGQLQLPQYLTSSSFTGTPVGYLQFDASGNVITAAVPSGSMVYPSAGIPVSTGSAWSTSITDNSTNWNTAFSQTRQWDGGSTGLVAATGRTSLGLLTAATVDTGRGNTQAVTGHALNKVKDSLTALYGAPIVRTTYNGGDITNSDAVANTLANATGVSFAVTSGVTYKFEFFITFTSAATTTGSRWTLNGPTFTNLAYSSTWATSGTGSTTNNMWAYDGATVSGTTPGGQAVAVISGVITPSANGTLVVRFSSEISSSAVTIKSGLTQIKYEIL